MKKLVRPLVVLAALAALPQPAIAGAITFDFNVQFSNTTLPAGTGPWLRATLDDTAAGPDFDVRLTIQGLDLAATEFVSDWWFNLNPDLSPLDLNFDVVDFSDVSSVAITSGLDCCNADGGGLYDIKVALSTAAGPGRFTNGDSVVIDINWSGGALLATDFLFPASQHGGHGPFMAAAHIQGITTGEGSTFVAPGGEVDPRAIPAPEPGSLVLLGTGLTLVARRMRRR